MKKLFMGAMALSTFAIAICLVQISCSKTEAQSRNPASQLGKIIYTRNLSTSIQTEIWVSDYDGSNAVQVPYSLPAGMEFDNNSSTYTVKISPDGQTVFFSLMSVASPRTYNIYACDISGANVRAVRTASSSNEILRFGQAF